MWFEEIFGILLIHLLRKSIDFLLTTVISSMVFTFLAISKPIFNTFNKFKTIEITCYQLFTWWVDLLKKLYSLSPHHPYSFQIEGSWFSDAQFNFYKRYTYSLFLWMHVYICDHIYAQMSVHFCLSSAVACTTQFKEISLQRAIAKRLVYYHICSKMPNALKKIMILKIISKFSHFQTWLASLNLGPFINLEFSSLYDSRDNDSELILDH